MPAITPENIVELPLPAVSVLPPSTTVVSVTPVRLWIVWLPPTVMSNVAPAALRLTVLLWAIEPPAPIASVPSSIAVLPV